MTQEEKLRKLEELRKLWKKTSDPSMKKVIEKRGLLIKWTLPKTMV